MAAIHLFVSKVRRLHADDLPCMLVLITALIFTCS